MIAILGDIHGNCRTLERAVETAADRGAAALIQVGDFGFDLTVLRELEAVQLSIPVYAIDGNHERFELLQLDAQDPIQLLPNLYYMPRGIRWLIDGRQVGFLGGAGSIDKHYRRSNGLYWSPLEQITYEQTIKATTMGPVDLLITHIPPQSTITRRFDIGDGLYKREQLFGVGPEWYDPSAHVVERVWKALGKPTLYCGHMHRSVHDGNVHVLDSGEVAYL